MTMLCVMSQRHIVHLTLQVLVDNGCVITDKCQMLVFLAVCGRSYVDGAVIPSSYKHKHIDRQRINTA